MLSVVPLLTCSGVWGSKLQGVAQHIVVVPDVQLVVPRVVVHGGHVLIGVGEGDVDGLLAAVVGVVGVHHQVPARFAVIVLVHRPHGVKHAARHEGVGRHPLVEAGLPRALEAQGVRVHLGRKRRTELSRGLKYQRWHWEGLGEFRFFVFIIFAKDVFFCICLLFHRIMQKLQDGLPLNYVEPCGSGKNPLHFGVGSGSELFSLWVFFNIFGLPFYFVLQISSRPPQKLIFTFDLLKFFIYSLKLTISLTGTKKKEMNFRMNKTIRSNSASIKSLISLFQKKHWLGKLVLLLLMFTRAYSSTDL